MHKDSDDLGTLVVEAARDIIASGGYDNLSMRKIAERIGYSPAAIYRHFRDREAILIAVCEETLTMLLKRLKDVAEGETDSLTLLREALLSYLQLGVRVQEHYAIAASLPQRALGELRAKGTGLRLYRLFRDMVKRCMEENAIRQLDPDLVAQGLWAVAFGFTSLAGIETFPWKDGAELAEYLVDIQIRGLTG